VLDVRRLAAVARAVFIIAVIVNASKELSSRDCQPKMMIDLHAARASEVGSLADFQNSGHKTFGDWSDLILPDG